MRIWSRNFPQSLPPNISQLTLTSGQLSDPSFSSINPFQVRAYSWGEAALFQINSPTMEVIVFCFRHPVVSSKLVSVPLFKFNASREPFFVSKIAVLQNIRNIET